MSGDQLEPGALLNGRYRILRVIGKGGMGTVYQAEHVRLDMVLAVKEVRAPQTADADYQALLEQCEHEARFLVRLQHPNLPKVTDAFLEDDRFYVVMEYIEGVTLEARERAAGPGGLPVARVVDWGLQIADVLSYLHAQESPIIFRDLKPANVMVQADGRVRLIDFGIARRFQPGAVKDTTLLGSVGYSPPEQFGRHQTDVRTDIYAFGATLHNLLTGRDPSHSPFKFASVNTLNPAVPEPLSRLIDHCLRLDADARPSSISEVAAELIAVRDLLPPVEAQPAAGAAEPVHPPGPPSGGAKIILTNPTLRGSGKTVRSPSAPLGSQKPDGVRALSSAGSGAASASDASHEPAAARALWLGVIGTCVLIGGLAVWMFTARPKAPAVHANEARGHASGPAVPPVDPAPHTEASVSGPPAAPTDGGSASIAPVSRAVTFSTIAVKGTIIDPQGHTSLRIAVAGVAEGQVGDQVVIAAFFYDDQYAQIASQLPQSPYSSKDGKLSVATTLTLSTARQPFDLLLDMPTAAFPPGITGGVQFHCVAFSGGERIGESKAYVPVPAGLLSAPAETPQNPSAPPDGGSGAPINPAPPAPGVFGSKPVRGE
jgi:serine/threonine protein kinase